MVVVCYLLFFHAALSLVPIDAHLLTPNVVIREQFQQQDHQHIASSVYETMCWGCGVRLLLPSIVPTYKCGWCGAISNNDIQPRKQGWCLKCSQTLDHIIVAMIISLMLLIICGGMWAIFPILFTDFSFSFFFHLILTGLLAFNTLFNYCVAAFVQAGPPPQIAWGTVELVNQGALDGYRFCNYCQKPKPPQAHHCRSCKACVLDMDHHCPFIGNCVGAANHRPFILFLVFVILSSLYICLMSVATIVKIWYTRFDSGKIRGIGWNMNGMEVFFSFLQVLVGNSMASSMRAIGLLYLVAVGLSVIIGVGLLLYQQTRQVYDGQTFIDTLQQNNYGMFKETIVPVSGWRNFRRIFGHGHPVSWILPKFVVTRTIKVHDK